MIRIFVLFSALLMSAATAGALDFTVTLTSPKNGEHYPGCTDIVLSAEPKIDEGRIRYVRFYSSDGYIARATEAPWEGLWENVIPGKYQVWAMAHDAARNKVYSDTINITVGEPVKGNKIRNGGFDCQLYPWELSMGATSSFEVELYNDWWFNDSSYAAVIIEAASDTNWHIMLVQTVGLDIGHTYEISFWADAEESKEIHINFQETVDDYTVHYWHGPIIVEQLDFYGPYIWQSTVTDPSAQFKMILGANTIDIYIDDVRIIDQDATGVQDSKPAGSVVAPGEFRLACNFPNPFNAGTVIPFKLGETAHVVLEIYNVSGRCVKTLIDENRTAGWHSIRWDGTGNSDSPLPTGVYLTRLSTSSVSGTRVHTGKALLLR